MEKKYQVQRGRGRPPKTEAQLQTRERLLRAGLEILTEKGFSASGIDGILKQVGIPKGSFYHYFNSKEAFGLELVDEYGRFFSRKLHGHFNNTDASPLARLKNFTQDARAGLEKFAFERGCLVGKLGQEVTILPGSFRTRLMAIFTDWKNQLALLLLEAKAAGEINADTDCEKAAAFFWIGWEGAVLQAGLEKSLAPLDIFVPVYIESLKKAVF